jgi:hypothetical protein
MRLVIGDSTFFFAFSNGGKFSLLDALRFFALVFIVSILFFLTRMIMPCILRRATLRAWHDHENKVCNL